MLAPLALVFNAFTWGVSWWPFRRLEAAGLHPLWLTAITFAVAVAGLLLVRPKALGEVARTPALWVLVLAAGTTNACFNWGVTVGDVVRVVLLFYLMPLWAVLLARPLLGERIHAGAVLRIALALGGAVIVLWPKSGAGFSAFSLPDVLGVVGGFSFALNNVMLRREAKRSEPARALAMFGGGMLIALLLALAQWRSGAIGGPPLPAGGWIAGTAALAAWFVASNLALQYGAARLPAATTAVIMLTEVVFASASALLLGAGELDARTAIGGSLILAAAALAALRRG
ncbi:DMT family transporter [Aquincola sp. S2]|uniref:DMT family transporter n=2 Tax=Pseudaquabacterium terrae TaxID=2732868 RepID=A0ABX2ELT0_9BURK|nr:DMT family transporter [Aquabacterium terrae]NRF69532.1 DMT family transporter [Aquabacterium terrae]